MLRRTAIVVSCLALTGCASVTHETTQPMKVETKTDAGLVVVGADCKLTNNYGTVSMKSGDTAQVQRSGTDMDLVCKHPENPDATARAISRANAGMLGNIIVGGVVGAIIDHNTGKGYTYPTWVQLVFGKTIVFDSATQKDGQPARGPEPAASSPPCQVRQLGSALRRCL